MSKTLNAFALSAALALGLAVTSLGPAEAGIAVRDSAAASQAQRSAPVVDVQYRHHHRRHHYRRHYRHRHHHRYYRGGSGFFFGFGTPYYRPYYARPPVYVRPRYVAPAYGLSRAHVRWCYNRYRSYRASDNTFQPYHGPRRQCYSPYR